MRALVCIAVLGWSQVAAAAEPAAAPAGAGGGAIPPVPAYTTSELVTLAYYKQHYPAFYAQHYAPLIEPPPMLPKPKTLLRAERATAEADRPEVPKTPGMVSGESDDWGSRTLDGHTFIYPRLVDTAFTASNFHVGTSVEFYHQAGVTSKVTELDGTVQELEYDRDLAFVRLDYGVHFQLMEVVSIGLDADYLAEVGANQESLMLYGGQTGYDFRPTAKLRMWRSEDYGLQLAMRGYATVSGGVRAVPQGILSEVVTEERAECVMDRACAIEEDALDAITRTRNGGGGSVSLAKSLGRYVGMQAMVGFEGARLQVEGPNAAIDATSMVFSAGASPSLDFFPGWPVGVALEYRFDLHRQQISEITGTTTEIPQSAVLAKAHRFGASIHYTGRRDLMLGWSAGGAYLEDAERGLDSANAEPNALVFAAQFDMRYFF
jgi:hypothetical protein